MTSKPQLKTQRSSAATAATDTRALSSNHCLMEKIVAPANMEQAWQNVKANRGAPGADGVTLEQFAETIATDWPAVKQQLLEGTYRPGPARRKSIPKPDGSLRHLGIPNVVDRVIQQAVLQILTPIFDPHFSESSYGFRPKRSAHGAIKQIQTTIRSDYRHCVDMDLLKFFDRVQTRCADGPSEPQSLRPPFIAIDWAVPASGRDGRRHQTTFDRRHHARWATISVACQHPAG